jgi:hypothetical protein
MMQNNSLPPALTKLYAKVFVHPHQKNLGLGFRIKVFSLAFTIEVLILGFRV